LTRSFGVAWDYAVHFGRSTPATPANPGFVYEVEIDEPPPLGLVLLDPVREVVNNAPGPLAAIPYQHDGSQEFLLGVVSPTKLGRYLKAPCRQPPPATGTKRPPNLSLELEALIRAVRDSEILAIGVIPTACVRNRYPVHA
jgi:hypothetical protein